MKRQAGKIGGKIGGGRAGHDPRNLLTSLVLVFPLFLIYQIGVLFTLPVLNGADFLTVFLFRNLGLSTGSLPRLHLRRRGGVRHRRGRAAPQAALRSRTSSSRVLLESAIYALTMGSLIVFVMTRGLGISPQLAGRRRLRGAAGPRHADRDVARRGRLRGDGVPPRHPGRPHASLFERVHRPAALDRASRWRSASGRCCSRRCTTSRPTAIRCTSGSSSSACWPASASACSSGTAASRSPSTRTPSTISTCSSMSRSGRRLTRGGADFCSWRVFAAGLGGLAASCRAWRPWPRLAALGGRFAAARGRAAAWTGRAGLAVRLAALAAGAVLTGALAFARPRPASRPWPAWPARSACGRPLARGRLGRLSPCRRLPALPLFGDLGVRRVAVALGGERQARHVLAVVHQHAPRILEGHLGLAVGQDLRDEPLAELGVRHDHVLVIVLAELVGLGVLVAVLARRTPPRSASSSSRASWRRSARGRRPRRLRAACGTSGRRRTGCTGRDESRLRISK